MTTGESAAGLNPELIEKIRWWEDQRFHDLVSIDQRIEEWKLDIFRIPLCLPRKIL